jgi:N-acetylmuramoyl-L-alanine amidase
MAAMKPIRRGAAGPDVEDIQRRLEALDLSCDEDDRGVYGHATEHAVRVFQQRRGLTADGTVGEDTWSSLVEAGYHLGDRLLYERAPMLRGDDVLELQRRLNRLGFDTGYTDGVFGPLTADAVREFQLNSGLDVDGKVGASTVGAVMRLHRQHQVSPAFAVRERESLRSPVRRDSIAGVRLLIDPGHSPEDPGFTAPNGVPEHLITWQLASRVAGRLGAIGARPILARGPNNSPGGADRAELANREEVEAIVSIHLNGLPQPEARGASAYYFGSDVYVSERGRSLAQLCVDNIVEATGAPNCRTHPATLTILRASRAPAVVIEPGFLSHTEEAKLLQDPSHQGVVAEAIVQAVETFLLGVPVLDSGVESEAV